MNAHTTFSPECPADQHRTFSLAATPARSAITRDGGFTKLWRAFRAWQRQRRAVGALRVLDDRTLRDIGIDRSEIRSVVIEHQAGTFLSLAAPDRPAEWAVNLPRRS